MVRPNEADTPAHVRLDRQPMGFVFQNLTLASFAARRQMLQVGIVLVADELEQLCG